MKILNIIQGTNLGGMEQSNLLSLKGLQALGHDVHLVSLNPLGALAPKLREASIPAIGMQYKGRYGWRSIPEMRRSFAESASDAVLMTGHNISATLALIGLKAHSRVLSIHYHHFENSDDRLRWRVFYQFAASVFDHVTFVSEFIRDEALTIYPRLELCSRVIPNPFELPETRTADDRMAARAILGLPKSAKIIGNAGWLIPRKRFDIFLRVAAKILAQNPDTFFVVAGDGPERSRLLDLACSLRIESKVNFVGWQSDLRNFYKCLDILLFNSDFDALGRTPAEAASYGVPIVGSVIHGGLPELFRSEDEAIIFREHNVSKLADAVCLLLSDHQHYADLAERGRSRVAEYGDVRRHAATMELLLSNRK